MPLCMTGFTEFVHNGSNSCNNCVKSERKDATKKAAAPKAAAPKVFTAIFGFLVICAVFDYRHCLCFVFNVVFQHGSLLPLVVHCPPLQVKCGVRAWCLHDSSKPDLLKRVEIHFRTICRIVFYSKRLNNCRKLFNSVRHLIKHI